MGRPLMLICVAGTRSARIGGFPAPDEPLDEGGRKAAAAATLHPRFRAHAQVSPMLAALGTAAAMNLDVRKEAALADIDCGAWRGRMFEEVHTAAPKDFARWLADPTHPPPGGESMEEVKTRAGAWLDGIATIGVPVCAITHATVIRAALAHVLDLPLTSTLAIDIMPLSRTMLSFNRVWRLQSIGPID